MAVVANPVNDTVYFSLSSSVQYMTEDGKVESVWLWELILSMILCTFPCAVVQYIIG